MSAEPSDSLLMGRLLTELCEVWLSSSSSAPSRGNGWDVRVEPRISPGRENALGQIAMYGVSQTEGSNASSKAEVSK